MSRIRLLGTMIVVIFLFACSPTTTTISNPTPTIQIATATMLQETVTPTATVQATATEPLVTEEPAPLLLSEPGPYQVGKRKFTLEDTARESREVSITVWYPALRPADSTGSSPTQDADPDFRNAPYPLILSSTKVAHIFAPYLITYGFTWASVDKIDTYLQMNHQMFDQPLDILFTLDQVATNPPTGLEGMIDSEHSGVIGYSFDGYNSLALSGGRINPEYYLDQCPVPDAVTEAVLSGMSSYNCAPALDWEEFSALAGEAITDSEDGLWQPMTDDRIRAVMPIAGEGWWLFGKRGLTSVDRPILIIVATRDTLYSENALIFEHIGTPEKTLISFVGGPGHMMIYDDEEVAKMAHFASAFFGYHLQGQEDLAWYFSEEYVSQHDDLAWGVYSGD